MGRDSRQREIFKKKLADAALDEFSSKGFISGRINVIATSIGVDPIKIYYYVGNKEKVYRDIFEKFFGEVFPGCLDRFFAEVDKWDTGNDKKVAALMYLASGFAEKPEMYKVTKLCELDMMDGRRTVYEYVKRYLVNYMNRIESVIKDYLFEEMFDLRDASIFLFSLYSFIKSNMIFNSVVFKGDMGNVPQKPGRDELYCMLMEFTLNFFNPSGDSSVIPLLDDGSKKIINRLLSDTLAGND